MKIFFLQNEIKGLEIVLKEYESNIMKMFSISIDSKDESSLLLSSNDD